VKRQAKIIRSSDDGKRQIAIDAVNYQKIRDFIFRTGMKINLLMFVMSFLTD
jgi:hypothetical protein